LVLVLAGLPAAGQSGRNKNPTPDPKKGPVRPNRGGDDPLGAANPKPTPTPPPVADADTSSDEVVRVASNLVDIPTSVFDNGGEAVNDLTLADFQLLVDGEQKPISDLLHADTPVRLALLFDNSSSLSYAREFEKQAAIRFFRKVLRPQDQAALYSVATDVTLVQPLTNNVKLLVQGIENFGKPEGATALFDGLVMAADYLKQQHGRRIVIIVSDGDDTISDIRFEDSVQIAQAADCQIYVVQTTKIENAAITGNAVGRANLRALAAERRMEQATQETGGAVFAPYSTKELDPAFTQIAADLASQYILSYYPQDEKFDGRFRLLTVRLLNGKSFRVRARKGYYTPRS
jgi:Ca-activated chloride channel family protein